ncbi:MAG: TIGR03808 family TAT-translocated repetitive protein [Devosia sp.]|uniref:TIGR03808 family TAT-translocated repetitive protein n=1 Tax=Devosia sp. TaxID=1871048 RepID=UPI0024CB3E33|nr:TIGR03808 family TAT-translocated repetitive protein [Devosia sp.]UYN99658.1 MAG: TIGR03808 family TAT-translocated repetitive protein [Devosia sp.]
MRMMTNSNRRQVMAGLAGLGLAGPALAQADSLIPDGDMDQSAAMQAAIDGAFRDGYLRLPPGHFWVSGLRIPGNLVIEGVPGATALIANGGSIGAVEGQYHVSLRDIAFAGDSGGDSLFSVSQSRNVSFERCLFSDSPGIGLAIDNSEAVVRDCGFSGHGDAAIHALDNSGLLLTGNRITRCGNAGIRVWRSEEGPDGTIVANNRISDIAWVGGGNGQNGNGINIFRADEVIVAGNHISDCAFTAVRLNTTRNVQVSGNQCLNSGEVAIFSEFGFSGSIIAQNIVDGAATGISITNLDSGGKIAVCTGNIVRNILERSPVNPDTIPIGIFAEGETAITGNMVDNVPGVGIGAGWGPYLRNVLISGNTVSASTIGIAVSIADGAGSVTIGANQLEGSTHDIAGMLWTEIAEPDLRAAASRYPHVTFS